VEVLASAGVGVVFLPHCDGTEPSADDLAMAHRLTAATKVPLVVADPMPPDHLAVSLIRRASVTVGSRFHLSVLGAGAGVPAVAFVDDLPDQAKAASLAAEWPDHVVAVALPAPDAVVAGATREALARGPQSPLPAWSPIEFIEALRAAAPVLDTRT
jgi:hypothetical protein